MKNLLKILPVALVLVPVTVFAQSQLASFISYLKTVINNLIVVVAALALLVFFWGLVKFIWKIGGDEKAVSEGRTLMIWGIVALFVMVSVWGLVRFIGGEVFGRLDNADPTTPNIR